MYLKKVNIQAILEDTNGDLLIGTWEDGLFRYVTGENRFIHYPMENQSSILSLFQDSRGTIWVGGSGSGLHRAEFSADKEDISLITYRHTPTSELSLCSNYIYSMDEDLQTHSLWLGTREGVSIMNIYQEGTFVNYQDTGTRYHLPVHEVNSVFRDKNGLMWIGTKGAGVFYANTRLPSFHIFHSHNSKVLFTDYISALYVEENGAIWAGFGYGVDYYHRNKTTSVVSTPRPYHISCSASTREVLLSAHDEGVITCRDGRKINQYTTRNCDFIPHDLVFTVYEDKKGNWWLGTYMGLGVRYKDGRSYCFNRLEGSDKLLTREITSITEGNDNTLWLATNNNGIIHVRGNMEQPEELLCKNYCIENGSLPVNTPLCFLVDSQGQVWAGTEGSGLCLYDTKSDSFRSVHRTYNLPGDMVGSMEEDELGNIWVGTNQGLAKLSPSENEEFRVRIFTVSDGLADNFF